MSNKNELNLYDGTRIVRTKSHASNGGAEYRITVDGKISDIYAFNQSAKTIAKFFSEPYDNSDETITVPRAKIEQLEKELADLKRQAGVK